MSALPIRRRKFLLWGSGAAVASTASALAWWPGDEAPAAYPFARRVAGAHEALWSVPIEELTRASEDDAVRLERLLASLDRGVTKIERLEPRLSNAAAGELNTNDRELLREHWWRVFEPILAIDELKSLYRGWYGLDYLKHAGLHSRAYALSFAALCGQVDAGLRLLAAISGKRLLPVLFDEAMPSVGLPARTLSGLRERLARARDLFLIPLGDEWYQRWIARHLTQDSKLTPLAQLLDTLRGRARKQVLTPTPYGVENKLVLLRSQLFQRWFPLQKGIAEWAGDTRFAKRERRLIDAEKLAVFRAKLEPGDIILERRNWYLSNIGLPGFWPHAALYAGTQRQILAALADAPDVKSAIGDLEAYLQRAAPTAWATLAARDPQGHELCVIEAVSEGVVTASVEHSCGADYVAALRPKVPALTRVRAIERALKFWGRPYDFNFDFVTDDQVVCSELIVKAYEPLAPGAAGLNVPYVELVGRRAVPPTEIVRTFRDERDKAERQLDFVYFLEGRESESRAVVADADALAATIDRPKWDIAQP